MLARARRSRATTRRLALLSSAAADAVFFNDLDGVIGEWNEGAAQMYGYSRAEAVGRHVSMLAPDELRDEIDELLARARAGEVSRIETQRIRRDGWRLDVALTVSPVRDARGRVIGAATFARDISALRRSELERERAERLFKAAFENGPIGIAITGLRGRERGRMIQTNRALAEIVGWAPGELDGVLTSTITHPDDADRTAEILDLVHAGETGQVEKRFLHRGGREIWALVSATPIPEPAGGQSAHCVVQVLDISDRKRFEGQLRHLADHDTLTGLFNRHRFESELQRVVDESRRYGRRAGLLALDLDGFKLVNDRFGHQAGDELVRRLATLMRQSIRETDIVARIGGDEFAIILQQCTEAEAIAIAEKILHSIRRRGFMIDTEHQVSVTTSIGVTTFDDGLQLTASELVVEADIAMYDAKAAGKDRYSVYDRALNRRAVVSARHSWLERLRTALDEEVFVLHAQPIVGICHDGFPRYELLLRLPDDHGDLIPPGSFLYNAERFDLMGEIDRWVLRRATELLHEHSAAGNDIALSVNLSGRSMNDLQLAADIAEMLAEHPIPEGRLIVEVTETAAIVNIERARDLARELRLLGCRFALDDFGAGFASFYYLKHLDFDYLKIDGEFIHKLRTTPTDRLVVSAIVDIARGLRTETVAEFVGDDATLELLRELGVGYGQGYHLGRPAPLAEALPALATPPDFKRTPRRPISKGCHRC